MGEKMKILKISLTLLLLMIGAWSQAQCVSDVQAQINELQSYQQTLNNIISPTMASYPQYTQFNNMMSARDFEEASAVAWDFKVVNGQQTNEMIPPRDFPNLFPSGAFAPF